MNKRIGLTTFALLIMILLAGCQLASEDGMAEKSTDKLIGAFVTYEHINLFDMEGFINDKGRVSGGEILVEGNQQKYNVRFYATRKDTVETTEEGDKYTKITYGFDGIDGVEMFNPNKDRYQLNDSINISSCRGAGITDYKTNVKYSDTEEGIEYEGKIYIAPDVITNAIYTNPVYQSSDGRIYLLSGQGVSCSSDDTADGSIFGHTITDKVSETKNGETKDYSTTVKISIEVMNPTRKVAIIQMDKESRVLKKEEYKPGEVPKELNADSSTEYIIVESTKTMKSGETKVERTIFSKSDDSLWYFLLNDNKVFVKTYTTIIWNKLEDQAE